MIREKYKQIRLKVMPNYVNELKKELEGLETLLDVGCGDNSLIRLSNEDIEAVGVDGFDFCINESERKKLHQKYFKMDILDLEKEFKKNSFDCVLASDVIEHLEKDEGIKLLNMMEKIAKKKVIVVTPNGFLPQTERKDGNDLQAHKSGWSVKEMRNRRYNIRGLHGFKFIRGERGKIKLKPYIFWGFISDLSQYFTYNFPKSAFHLFCVKTKKEVNKNG